MWQFLKKYFLSVVLVIVAITALYLRFFPRNPCNAPIEYSLGTIDAKFSISKAEYLSDIDQATQIWEKAIGKNLFEDDSSAGDGANHSGDLSINLIYDSRQALVNQHNTLTAQVDSKKETADQVKAQFTALQATYKIQSAEYESMLGEFKKAQASHTSRNDLNTMYAALESKRLAVNALSDQINALIKEYNSMVGVINAGVKTVNQNAGKEFEEGEYVSDAKGERINIYEFESKAILIRVLAHELGHAMGLDHNDNPDSIMYYLNQGTNDVPTKEDVAALKVVCGIK